MEATCSHNPKVTVLLIEDDEVDVMGVQRAFHKHELAHPIIHFSSGIEALKKLKAKLVPEPYLVLLDLNTPRLSGIEFLDEARKDPELHKAIVFVLTTSNAEDDISKAYARNIAGYIVKDDEDRGFINAANLVHQYARSVVFP